MSDDIGSPREMEIQGGLITQRMSAERGRGTAILWITLGLGWWPVGISSVSRSMEDWYFWPQVVGCAALGAYFVTSGVLKLLARQRRVAAFIATHGEDAGRQ